MVSCVFFCFLSGFAVVSLISLEFIRESQIFTPSSIILGNLGSNCAHADIGADRSKELFAYLGLSDETLGMTCVHVCTAWFMMVGFQHVYATLARTLCYPNRLGLMGSQMFPDAMPFQMT